jgi:hypothetical protein
MRGRRLVRALAFLVLVPLTLRLVFSLRDLRSAQIVFGALDEQVAH